VLQNYKLSFAVRTLYEAFSLFLVVTLNDLQQAFNITKTIQICANLYMISLLQTVRQNCTLLTYAIILSVVIGEPVSMTFGRNIACYVP